MAVSITLNDDRSEKIRYNYPGYPVYMREALLSQYPEYRAPSHWHDDIEFICVLSGGMKYNVIRKYFITPLIQNSRMPYLLLCPSDSAARRQLFCRNIS